MANRPSGSEGTGNAIEARSREVTMGPRRACAGCLGSPAGNGRLRRPGGQLRGRLAPPGPPVRTGLPQPELATKASPARWARTAPSVSTRR